MFYFVEKKSSRKRRGKPFRRTLQPMERRFAVIKIEHVLAGARCALALALSIALSTPASDAGRIQQLVDIVKKGPSLYRSPEAAAAYARFNPQGGIPAVSTSDGFIAIKQSIRAAIGLGDFGDKARSAVPTLIEVFPQAEFVSVIANAQFSPGMGLFDDWVQTYVISTKSKFLLAAPLVDYQTLSVCEQFVEASGTTDFHSKRMSGDKVAEANVDIYVTIRVNAAACALSKITGADGGKTRESWRDWYARSTTPSAQAAGQPADVKITVVNSAANPPSDYVPGARYQISLTTGDIVVGVVESSNETSFTIRTDDGGRYNYEKNFVKNRLLLSPSPYQSAPAPSTYAPAQANPPAGASIPYEELMNFSYAGRTMEVVLANGTVMRGALGVVDANILHLTVDGTEMPISRSLILRVSLVPDPAASRPADKPAPSASPSPW
jgi:hypothetical protein